MGKEEKEFINKELYKYESAKLRLLSTATAFIPNLII